MTEKTSARIAKIASKGIQTGKLTASEIKAVCASALTQREAEKGLAKPARAWGVVANGLIIEADTYTSKRDFEQYLLKFQRIARVEIREIPRQSIERRERKEGKK